MLTIVNSATTDIGVQSSLLYVDLALLGMCPEVGDLDHMVILFLTF
jgi:hypothetical protein